MELQVVSSLWENPGASPSAVLAFAARGAPVGAACTYAARVGAPAEVAGLACDNGIVVDNYSRTEDVHIYAAGDCTSYRHPFAGKPIRLESVQNANDPDYEKGLAHPCGVRIDPQGRIVIIDHTRNRLQVYIKEEEPALV